jgi:hypothetical protein
MFVKFHHGGGYRKFIGTGVVVGFGRGKNVSLNNLPLLLLLVASHMILSVAGSLICSMGILALPASEAGEVISLLASQILDSSMPSNHCTQCSALVFHISSEYRLHCCRYSSCIGCHSLRRWYFNRPPSCRVFFFLLVSLSVHHLFM